MTSRSLLCSPFHPTCSVIMIVASISVLLFSPSENPVILKTFMLTSGLIIYGQMDRQICIPELTEISQLNFQLFGEIKTFTHFFCLLFSMTKSPSLDNHFSGLFLRHYFSGLLTLETLQLSCLLYSVCVSVTKDLLFIQNNAPVYPFSPHFHGSVLNS